MMLSGYLTAPMSATRGCGNEPSQDAGTYRLDHPAGRHATDGHEPRQVRKEAAISDAGCVVVCYRSG